MNYMKSLSACALTNSFFRVYIYATGLKKKKKARRLQNMKWRQLQPHLAGKTRNETL